MVSRVPPPADGSVPKTSSALALILVLALAVGIWLLNGRDPGTGTDPGLIEQSRAAAPSSTSSSPEATSGPSSSASSTPSSTPAEPSTQASPTTRPAPATDLGDDPESGLPYVSVDELPDEALDTLDLIDRGGPYPYDKDGSTFGNFEGLLPDQERGYYSEYTVDTPGSSDRGARRIVAGDEGDLYWTEDHYDSFERILR